MSMSMYYAYVYVIFNIPVVKIAKFPKDQVMLD